MLNMQIRTLFTPIIRHVKWVGDATLMVAASRFIKLVFWLFMMKRMSVGGAGGAVAYSMSVNRGLKSSIRYKTSS